MIGTEFICHNTNAHITYRLINIRKMRMSVNLQVYMSREIFIKPVFFKAKLHESIIFTWMAFITT